MFIIKEGKSMEVGCKVGVGLARGQGRQGNENYENILY